MNLNLGFPLFNDRVKLIFDGVLDVPLPGDIRQSVNLYPNITIEFLINKSGSLRANVFYKENADFLATGANGVNQRRYGASIGYGRSFNTLSELFGFNKKKEKKDSVVIPVKDSTGTN